MNEQFKAIFAKRNFVVLDTVTTGLSRPAEIIDISILDSIGQPLLSQLVHPKMPISPFISELTGISNAMVEDFADWPSLRPYILNLIAGKDVITYNAKFDRMMFHCSDEMWQLPQFDYKLASDWHCAMLAYADYHGEWDAYHQSNKWQKLTEALKQQGLPIRSAHRAFDDAKMTYELVEHLCL